MMRVHVETGAPLEVCKQAENAIRTLFAVLIFAPLAFVAGCAGVLSQKSSSNTPPPQGQTYSVSGTISPGAGGTGATVTLSGASTASAIADSSGNFTFTGLANGTYAVTPNRTGYTFGPTSQSAMVNGANVTGVNFSASAQGSPTFSISGTISPIAAGSGATVKLSGAASTTVTANGSGAFTFTGFGNGTYTVTPSKSGYSFSPVSLTATINGANVTGLNFSATAGTTHTAVASWTPSTSIVSGYNVYRATVSGGPYTKVNSVVTTLLTYTDSTVVSGQTYFYVATAVDGIGNESVFSNQVTAAIP